MNLGVNNKDVFYNNCFDRLKNNENSRIYFSSGWSNRVGEKINQCDIDKIVRKLAANNIKADFNGNKVLAWCCYKVTKIFKRLNKEFGLNLELPKAIYVMDLSKKHPEKNIYGMCNWYPAYLEEATSEAFPERTVIFNSFETRLSKVSEGEKWWFQWDNIDALTEEMYKKGITSSDHFLNMIIHEFCHAAHNGFLLKKFVPEEILSKLERQTSPDYCLKYKQAYDKILSDICSYASTNQYESIATDMSKKIVETLDNIKFYPLQNPFHSSSYPVKSIFFSIKSFLQTQKEQFKRKVLKKAWNGEDLV